MVNSLQLPGLQSDASFPAQYQWHSTWGLDGATVRDARIGQVRLGEHDGFYLINRRIKPTFEHPFLVRRDEAWGFCSAELLNVGDYLITVSDGQLDEERIDSLERIDGIVRTVAIHVPGTNTYLADGVWTHNDAKASSGSGPVASESGGTTGPSASASSSGSSSGSSSSSKSSSSSFSSSSETPSIVQT